MADSINSQIAAELAVREGQVAAAIGLLDSGATVPFIARYRKEATGALDDAQLRMLSERLRYLRELSERRGAVLDSIAAQGKLTEVLRLQILAADTKARLEDIYLPFKPKRRTRAQIAREAGLQPLADRLLADATLDPATAARSFCGASTGVADAAAALDGARAILTEQFSEDADLVGELREHLWSTGWMFSSVRDGKAEPGAKFADYFDYSERLAQIPSHRALALFRGEKDGVLDLALRPGGDDSSYYEGRIAVRYGIAQAGRAADRWLADCVRWAWRTRLETKLAVDLRLRLRQAAEQQAVAVFAGNLRDLLLAAPAGQRVTMGLDPGLRTGVKVAVVDRTGKVVATETVYPHPPHRKWSESVAVLAKLARVHGVELIAIGNGTASRETDRLAAEIVATSGVGGEQIRKAVVSEAGASVYSASAYASAELPLLDVSLRGAVSIARRLQDPLAELVKIDPKSIGVGQYQHDIPEAMLSRSLSAVVEDCVNAVGVDVNTASVPLLARVSGVGEAVAANIVAHRETNGAFATRSQLKRVPRLGAKVFEQSAGFLRIAGGADPLDASGVHPEAYPVVRRILASVGAEIDAVIGNSDLLARLDAGRYVDETFGVPTVRDIIAELDKPGRDPRPEFRTAAFTDGIEQVSDLRPGMVLEGTVTNVAAFGAFVDVGVHQDGLVHISAMSRSYVSDPRRVVKPGDIATRRTGWHRLRSACGHLVVQPQREPDSVAGHVDLENLHPHA